jgi:hypothetical protein
MVAPRQRIGPRSRYWVIVLFVKAATSQPKKVVPYLGVVSMDGLLKGRGVCVVVMFLVG